MHALKTHRELLKVSTEYFELAMIRPLRAPAELLRPALKQVEILHRPPQTSWIRDDSVKANQLLDGLASYLRTRDPK